jgi:hypothetical protein
LSRSINKHGRHTVSEEIFKKSTNQKQEWPVVAMLLMNRDEISNLYRGPSKDAPCQVSIHLAKRFQRRFLRNHPIIYGRSSLKIAHFVLIHQQTWPPQAILVLDWLISKKNLLLRNRFPK